MANPLANLFLRFARFFFLFAVNLFAGQPFQLKTGQAIILPANQPHAVKAQKKFKMLLTMIHV
jgi:quercetin dioxygenase-like cupin family protein